MPEYPIISKGLGKLTPSVWARLMRMLQDYESKSPRDERAKPRGSRAMSYFLAEITKAKVVLVQTEETCTDAGYDKAYQFEYAWDEVVIDGGGEYAASTLTGGRSSTVDTDEFALPALNALEIRNECDYATGIHISGGDYMATYYPLPFGGATASNLIDLEIGDEVDLRHELITVVHEIRDEDSAVRYVFAHMMQHDGGCE